MVQPDVARAKINRARSWLDEADAILGRPREEYLADARGRDLVAFYLFLAIQECIDLAAHWIADAGWEAPDEAAALFDLLADRAAITRITADSMRGATASATASPTAMHASSTAASTTRHRPVYAPCASF